MALAEQERNIDAMLGAMDGADLKGPRSPALPPRDQVNEGGRFCRRSPGGVRREEYSGFLNLSTSEFDGRTETSSLITSLPTRPRPISSGALLHPRLPGLRPAGRESYSVGVHDV